MILCKANAKINIGLDVQGKRADGYHEVDMLMLPLALTDTLSFTLLNEPQILLETSEELGPIEANLVYRAAKILQDTYDVQLGVSVMLEKRIPAAAGLGGGSSDCAQTLLALNKLWKLELGMNTLHEIAAKLGADVPFFLYNQAARIKGYGEKVKTLKASKSYPIVLLKPNISVSTASAYAQIKASDRLSGGQIDALEIALQQNNVEQLAKNLANSFERSFFKTYPDMKQVKRLLEEQGINVVLSGSGPTLLCFNVSVREIENIKQLFSNEDLKIIVTETLINE